MKTKATTLMIGIGITLALIVPVAQAAPEWGGGAAATPSARTLRTNTTVRHLTTTEPAHYFQVLRNSF
jgi:hypothetical protein